VRGGLVLLDTASSRVVRVIRLQYNPAQLTRTLETQAAGDGGDRTEALRLVGPPVETIQLEAEIDAADQLERSSGASLATDAGIHPQLAALETIVYPPAARLAEHRRLLDQGALEIAPVEAPLTVFVWSRRRQQPVRITQFSVTEEFFDPRLNPLRARVALTMKVLRPGDLGLSSLGAQIFDAYHREKERLSDAARGDVALADLGISRIERS
jgi:hypothetical protein